MVGDTWLIQWNYYKLDIRSNTNLSLYIQFNIMNKLNIKKAISWKLIIKLTTDR